MGEQHLDTVQHGTIGPSGELFYGVGGTITRASLRALAERVADPREILTFAWTDRAYLETLYWRRVAKDSAVAAASSKAARRRASVSTGGATSAARHVAGAEARFVEAVARRDEVKAQLDDVAARAEARDEEVARLSRERGAAVASAADAVGARKKELVAGARKDLGATLKRLSADNARAFVTEAQGTVGRLEGALHSAAIACAEAVGAAQEAERIGLAALDEGLRLLPARRKELEGLLERREGAVAKATRKLEAARKYAASFAEAAGPSDDLAVTDPGLAAVAAGAVGSEEAP